MAILLWAKIQVFLFLIVGLPVTAFAQEIEILSKEDARAVFSMTQEQWIANVQQAVAAGAAKATGTADKGLGMAMVGPNESILFVKPDYGEDARKPDFIQVTVAYRERTAELLSDDALKDVLEKARTQMEPEYEIFGNVESHEGGVALFFIITERGAN